MDFQWNETKRKLNLLKHQVDFADAIGVLYDDRAITIEDVSAVCEQRFVTIGLDFTRRLCVVVYTEPFEGSIRIISARKALPAERKQYWGESESKNNARKEGEIPSAYRGEL